MRILLYGINFTPELTGIGKYTGEMAEWLAMHEHEVRVVTAPPYYPDWRVAEGYRAWRYAREQVGAVSVWRCPLWVPAKVTGLKRLVHLASFALFSLPVMLRQVFWRPDVVWMVAPALMCAPAAIVTARLSGAKSVLHVQDYEVDAAFDLGLLTKPWMRRASLWVERVLLRGFDRVSTISEAMLDLAKRKGIGAERLIFFPNWANLDGFLTVNLSKNSIFRKALGFHEHDIVALYSGNMGAKQGLEVMADAARLSQSDARIKFLFCGNGMGRDELKARCDGLTNVKFIDFQPIEFLGVLLSIADIHLLPQRADVADLVMPSKLTGMLASGRPVVATAHAGTGVAKVVKHCGVVVAPGNALAMAAAVKSLADDSLLRTVLGAVARNYAQANLDKEGILKKFESMLLELVGTKVDFAESETEATEVDDAIEVVT